jgi:kynurenine formamidase
VWSELSSILEDAMRRSLLLVWTLSLLAGTAMGQKPGRRMIDLTYSFSAQTIYWPTAAGFQLKADSVGMTEKGYFYSAYSYAASEHGGTHMDAPVHFAKGMATIDQIPLQRLVTPGVVIDVQRQAAANRDYQITAKDLTDWEMQNGRIPEGCILLFRTGWGKFYPDAMKYLGTNNKGQTAVAELHFPGVDPSAAKWMVANRRISGIGIDTASIDYGQSQRFETHQILYQAGFIAIENVARLNELPVKGFEIVALPMKIERGSGAPVRIIAILNSPN